MKLYRVGDTGYYGYRADSAKNKVGVKLDIVEIERETEKRWYLKERSRLSGYRTYIDKNQRMGWGLDTLTVWEEYIEKKKNQIADTTKLLEWLKECLEQAERLRDNP